MGDLPTDAREGPTDDAQESDSHDLPEVTCTLDDEAAARRREWMEANLLPHLSDVRRREDGYSFVFERSPDAYEAVAEVAWKESQCCAWATFEVELPPGDGPIRWHERSDREAGTDLFGEALREEFGDHENVPVPE